MQLIAWIEWNWNTMPIANSGQICCHNIVEMVQIPAQIGDHPFMLTWEQYPLTLHQMYAN